MYELTLQFYGFSYLNSKNKSHIESLKTNIRFIFYNLDNNTLVWINKTEFQMWIYYGNDIQLYTNTGFSDELSKKSTIFSSISHNTVTTQVTFCRDAGLFTIATIATHVFRTFFLRRCTCVDFCDVFGWKYDTVVCKFNVKQCI